jgi:hypothetical protein
MADGTPPPGFPPGIPYIDPTENVKALVGELKSSVEAAMRRQDDLRDMGAEHERYISELRAEYEDKLRQAHDSKAELRADYGDKLRLAETARIDAIRAVDVGAVNRAAEVSATAAAALAAQLVATAEASRVQVGAAAAASVTSLAAALEPIQKDIRDLRDSQALGRGAKEQVVESRDVRAGSQLSAGTIMGAASLALVLIFGIIGIFIATRGH